MANIQIRNMHFLEKRSKFAFLAEIDHMKHPFSNILNFSQYTICTQFLPPSLMWLEVGSGPMCISRHSLCREEEDRDEVEDLLVIHGYISCFYQVLTLKYIFI